MMENLIRLPETKAFLADYPKSKWQDCMESVFVYGLYCLKRDFPTGLSIPELLKISGKEQKSPRKKSSCVSSVDKSPVLRKTLPDIDLKFSPYSSSVKNSACQTIDLNPTIPHLNINSFHQIQIKEPKICSIENAQELLKNRSMDEIFLKSPQFKTRLQKQGLRQKNFPMIDLNLTASKQSLLSLDSKTNSLSTSTLL